MVTNARHVYLTVVLRRHHACSNNLIHTGSKDYFIFVVFAKRNYRVLVRVCVFPCVSVCVFCSITQKVINLGT